MYTLKKISNLIDKIIFNFPKDDLLQNIFNGKSINKKYDAKVENNAKIIGGNGDNDNVDEVQSINYNDANANVNIESVDNNVDINDDQKYNDPAIVKYHQLENEIQPIDDDIAIHIDDEVTNSIKNNIKDKEDIIELKRCGPTYNEETLLSYSNPSEFGLYTIEPGTILYHASENLSTFNPYNIKLDNNSLVGLFSPNLKLASNRIKNCADRKGYVHKFIVKKNMPLNNALVISNFDRDSLGWNIQQIEKTFCNRKWSFDKYNHVLNAVGYFIKREIVDQKTGTITSENQYPLSEWAICDPNRFLEYAGTYQCIAPYRFHEYNFVS